MSNMYNNSPLALACVLGRDRIFAEMIELRCFVSARTRAKHDEFYFCPIFQAFWTYSIITCCGYPLSLIDSLQLINTKDGLSVETGCSERINDLFSNRVLTSDPQSALNIISEGTIAMLVSACSAFADLAIVLQEKLISTSTC